MILFQRREISPVVDVERLTIEDKGWDRFHSRRFGLAEAVLVFSQMHNLKIVTVEIEGLGDILLGRDANRATCMIEGGF